MSTKSSRVEAAPFAGGAPAGASGLVAEIDDRPVFSSYIDHFESAVAQWPDRCAVSVGDHAFSYRRLNQLAEAYAGLLRQHGCGAETIVAVSMERSIELAAALLAVMKCGAAFLPLDAEFPEERAKALVRQSGARVMMAHPRQAGIFDSCGAEVLRIQPGQIPSPSPPARSRRIEPSALAYLIYTSGSTGKPKGVAVSREAFYSYVRWALDYYRFDPRGVAPLHSSIGFDLTLTSLFCPLLCGMQVVMVPESEGFQEVIRLLDQGNQPVSLLKLTPSHLRLMAEEVGSRRPRWDCGVLILGGEQVTAQLVRFWEER
ncbi:MAG TPA: AMP-binding protein, partial [Acidobacteriota bacterium]|nr:AMP-binding protein [Acidobacteriota bacterium]